MYLDYNEFKVDIDITDEMMSELSEIQIGSTQEVGQACEVYINE